MKFLLLSLLLILSTFGFSQKLIIATYRYAENDRVRNITPFADHFAKTCGCEVQVKSYESVAALLAAMDQGEPSIVFINTFGYLMLREKNQNYQPSASLQIAENKKSNYQSVMVASQASGIKSLDDLKVNAATRSLLLVNAGSTSGNLVPRILLSSLGLLDAEKSFKQVTYTRNHLLTLKQIAEGKGDVGAFGSEEYDKALKADPEMVKKVTLLWTSDDIPLGPVVYKKELSRQQHKCLETTLLELHEKNPAALEGIKGGWTEAYPTNRFGKANDRDYENWLKKTGNAAAALEIIRKFAQ